MTVSVLVAAKDVAEAERTVKAELAKDGIEVIAVIEPREVVVLGLKNPGPFAIFEARVVTLGHTPLP